MNQIKATIGNVTVEGHKEDVLDFLIEYQKVGFQKQKIDVSVDTKNLWDTSDFFNQITKKLNEKGVNLNW